MFNYAGKKAEEHKKEMNALVRENELLKESIAKLSSEISTHSLVDLEVQSVCISL